MQAEGCGTSSACRWDVQAVTTEGEGYGWAAACIRAQKTTFKPDRGRSHKHQLLSPLPTLFPWDEGSQMGPDAATSGTCNGEWPPWS